MRTCAKLLIVALVATALAGCSATTGPKQFGGTLLGGIVGAVAGSQFGGGVGKLAMVAGGTLLGAFIGSEIGSSLDKADQLAAGQAAQSALESRPSGSTATWHNPDSGHSGTITPTRTYSTNSGYCREYQQTVTIGGKTQTAHGTACRQPDGSWKIQN